MVASLSRTRPRPSAKRPGSLSQGHGRPTFLRAEIREELVRTGRPARVDRDQGMIFGVKVVGRESPNTHGIAGVEGTDYLEDALREALDLYEGLLVNIDHPPRERPGKERSAYDRAAKLVNCRIEHGEMYADLQLLRTHPMAERLMEAAELMPDAFALSHNAIGRGVVENKRYVIKEIPEVRSVDIVADGGTCASLFEAREMKKRQTKTTLRQLIRESKAESNLRKALLEMGDAYSPDMMDAAMEKPCREDDAEEPGWKDHVKNAIGSLVDSEDPLDHDRAKKLMGHLKPEATQEAEEEDVEEDLNKEEETLDDQNQEGRGKPEKKAGAYNDTKDSKGINNMESRQRLARLERKDKVRDLCESLDFRPTPTQLEAMIGLGSEAKVKTFIQESKAQRKASPPRSVAAGSFSRPLQEGAEPSTAKGWAGRLLKK